MRSSCRAILLLPSLLLWATGCPTPIPSGVGVVAQTGASPNDAILIESPQKTTLVVAASLDSAVQFFDFTDPAPWMRDKSNDMIFFAPNSKGVSPNPWSMAATQDGKYLLVTLFDDHSVALVNLNTRKVLSTTEPMKPGDSRPLFSLAKPVNLPLGKDVLGDGSLQTAVTRMRAMHPTAVAIDGNQALVAFTNVLTWPDSSGAPSQYGPGVVSRFLIQEGKLEWMDSLAIPCLNPSDITLDQGHRPIIACSGSMRFDDEQNMQLHLGAGVAILEPLASNDPSTRLRLSSFIPLSHFAPAKVIANKNGLFLASAVKRQLLFLANDQVSEDQAKLISLNAEHPNESGYLASFVKWNDALAFVSDFYHDRVFALDLATLQLNPAPFESPVQLQHEDQPKICKGPQKLLRRQGSRSSVYPASDIFVVTAMSNEVFSIRLDGLSAL